MGTLISHHGLRTSELCGLCWRDVSLTDRSVSVEGQLARTGGGFAPTKSRAGVRTIPLTPPALAALYAVERARGFGGDDDFVFTTFLGGPLDRHNVRRIIRRAGKAAGLGHVTPQMLRRSVATAYAEADVPPQVAASITGHSPAVYHAHYAKPHRDQLEREQALARLSTTGTGPSG